MMGTFDMHVGGSAKGLQGRNAYILVMIDGDGLLVWFTDLLVMMILLMQNSFATNGLDRALRVGRRLLEL